MNSTQRKPQDTFIVDCGAKLFCILRYISPFWWLVRKLDYGCVEVWVLANFVLSIVLLTTCSAPNVRWWEWVAIVWGIARVYDVLIYEINVLLFDQYRCVKAGKDYAVRSYRRTAVTLLLNYFEIIFWFALFYRNVDWAFETGKASLNLFPTALHFSLVTMTGFGNTSISPTKILGYALTSTHMVAGLVMALLVLASFISWLPKPKTKDELER